MHEFIHNEGRSGHVSRILHKRDKRIEDNDIGQKNNHTPHTTDDAVDQQIFQRPIGHPAAKQIPQLSNQPFNPVHRVLSQTECRFKSNPQKQEKQRQPQILMGKYRIEFRRCKRKMNPGAQRLFQRPRNKSVTRIGERRFGILFQQFFDVTTFLISPGNDIGIFRQMTDRLFYIFVSLQ